jgi:hypothetical protein
MKRVTNVLSVCMAAGIVCGAIGIASAQQDKPKTPTAAPATTPPATPGKTPATPAKPTPGAAPTTPPAAPGKPGAPAGMPEMKLPAGWTSEDMQKMMEAGKPGPMHALLTKHAGTWKGQCTMWMAPDTEGVKTESTMTCTSIMDGRFTQVEMKGDSPMGPMDGLALYGYDNVAKKFQSTWVMNCGTGMMTGTGELASDGSTINWNYTCSCPIAQKACSMRETEKFVSDDKITFTTVGADPKTGKEFKMMEATFTRTSK